MGPLLSQSYCQAVVNCYILSVVSDLRGHFRSNSFFRKYKSDGVILIRFR